MRNRVVRFGNAALGIGPHSSFPGQHERGYARDVRLQSNRKQIEDQPRMLGEVRRDPAGLGQAGRKLARLTLRFAKTHFELADRGEVLVQLAPVSGAQRALETLRVLQCQVENALPVIILVLAFCRRAAHVQIPEQPLE